MSKQKIQLDGAEVKAAAAQAAETKEDGNDATADDQEMDGEQAETTPDEETKEQHRRGRGRPRKGDTTPRAEPIPQNKRVKKEIARI